MGKLFIVKIADIPAAPLVAFIIGAVLYFILAKAGLEPKVLEMTAAAEPAPAESAPQEAPAEDKPAEDKAGE